MDTNLQFIVVILRQLGMRDAVAECISDFQGIP